MLKEQFDLVKAFSSEAAYSSLNYSDYEDLKDAQCLCDTKNLKVLLNSVPVQPVIEYATNSIDDLCTFLSENPIHGVLHFVPKEGVESFKEVGFKVLAEFADFICKPLQGESIEQYEFANVNDVRTLYEISKACIGLSRGYFGETEAWLIEWLESNQIIVERFEGKIVAFCCVSIYNNGTTLWLREVAVHPAFQGKGYGHALVRKALDFGLKNGAEKAFLAVDVENHNAIKIYKKYGFNRRDDASEIHMVR